MTVEDNQHEQNTPAESKKLETNPFDTQEGSEPSLWEERFEAQINTFFDEAIARVPNFVDRHLRSFTRIMGRSLSPKTGFGDIVVGVRNLISGMSKTVGGPDFSTTTYTHDVLTEAFEREVVSTEELESLLGRLFDEFEDEKLQLLIESWGLELDEDDEEADEPIELIRQKLSSLMEQEIAHDPLLAQAIRSGIKLGLPTTLGFVLFGQFSASQSATDLYKKRMTFYHRLLTKLGDFEIPTWLGAVGWAGGVIGSMAVGGLMEYALNSVRDIKGAYIRQLNTARYILLYGENPEEPTGQGLLHVVRGLERQFERVQSLEGLVGQEDPVASPTPEEE